MAKRFGGRFSPGLGPQDGNRNPVPAAPIRHRLASRPKYVTIAALPFLFGAFSQDPFGLASSLAAFGVIASGMWMTTEGLAAEAAYQVRRTARRPAIPRKLFGSVLTGLGLGLGMAEPGSLAGAGIVGATGMVLHWLAFGADPMRDKGMEGTDSFQQDRAQKMIDEAETNLAQMRDAIRRTGDRLLEARVDRFADTVGDLFDRVRSNPGDLSAARRYLGVYLTGARDATVKFADLYRQTQDPAVRASYEIFLDDLEKDFSAKSRRLLDGDRTDLDIEISVLRDRLAREGVRATEPAQLDPPRTESARFLDGLLTSDRDKAR
ncbi:5-bromo-4-chloroindolyl phosphate hydrolysis family protein [uncultured Paracoccus sp.]|uniref:5-bromo-4-chloroindolyl phosphate hydrolysis family protein n=1 Tax=uncultured Paracoccus sp. TaxID=189685 RepID=UPI0025FC0C08|nr:5-bromo-4-chloroindolyl phosphate hydrolysis family protein [uncultured Paracoccus sp.]